MAKEWILNSVTNRFQLNFKRNVGAVSEEIRKCSPRNEDEWREYYFKNVRDESHIKELGQKLYVKITEVIPSEVDSITERDCIDYMFGLVIDRTYKGYDAEIQTIYGQLQQHLDVPIEAASDKWDRHYNVDFFIKVGTYFIGIQVKPISGVSHIPQIYQEQNLQKESHEKFKQKFGGNTFYIFSIKDGRKKVIYNTEVIDEIKEEIARLSK